MCLSEISEIKPVEVGTGWKVFKVYKQDDPGCVRSSFKTELHTIGKWSRATGDQPESGFHIYKKRSDARKCFHWFRRHCFETNVVIKKVIYKDAFLQGIGDGGFVSSHQDTPVPVVVAKRMMVLTNEQAKQK